jgi:hypothetical protein
MPKLPFFQMSRGGVWVRPRFDHHVWSQLEAVLSGEATSTNATEAFHSGFRKTVVANASFWTVVDDLRRLETKIRVQFDESQGRAGEQQANAHRNKRADEVAKDLKAVISSRLEFPTKSHFLKRLGQKIE